MTLDAALGFALGLFMVLLPPRRYLAKVTLVELWSDVSSHDRWITKHQRPQFLVSTG